MNRKPQGKLLAQVIRTHSEEYRLETDREVLRVRHPDAVIRTFHRDVKADRLTFPVHIITVRAKPTRVCSKCGDVIPADYPTNVTHGKCDGEIVWQ